MNPIKVIADKVENTDLYVLISSSENQVTFENLRCQIVELTKESDEFSIVIDGRKVGKRDFVDTVCSVF